MSPEELERHCLSKPGAWPDEPWEGDTVAKVGPKIFAFLGTGSVGVKCGPTAEAAAEWRDRYPDDVTASAYIGRYGWNKVRVTGAVPDAEVLELVDLSYDSVVAKLPRSRRPAPSTRHR